MEEANEATAFVDFANRDLHIHHITDSATQEEVLFSCCPEAFPGILFCATMRNEEAIIIKGCRRFCEYSGYLNSFTFTKALIPPLPAQDIIAIDAVFANHFRDSENVRDLNKVFLGFLHSRNRISTGHWGCGAFGGDKVHKFLQQLCAATVADVTLYYSTFRENETMDKLTIILNEIEASKAKVSDLFKIMTGYKNVGPQKHKVPFYNFCTNELAMLKLANLQL